MNTPSPEQAKHWIESAKNQIDRAWRLNREGFHAREGVPIQSVYVSVAGDHASLARALFLNGGPIGVVRAEFADAARHILKSFTMAYDEGDADCLGEKSAWNWVSETVAINGFNYALMAADFELARVLARWFRDRPDGRRMDPEVNRYAHALKLTLLGENIKAWHLVKKTWDHYHAKPPKGGYKLNYYTLSLAVLGILDRNEQRFNEGLEEQMRFYASYARGEGKDTDEEFICDHAVALANLGIHLGLKVAVEHDTLPKGLLIQL